MSTGFLLNQVTGQTRQNSAPPGDDGGNGGNNGSLGQGGWAPFYDDAGAGGGGYYGGGSGGGGYNGGGGGAGSSFWAADATGTSMTEDTTGTPLVTISWIPPAADLKLANTGSPDPATRGQPLTYTLTATNTGELDATGVTVTDPLPASAVFGSMSASQGSCTRTVGNPNKNKDGTVTCNLGTVTSTVPATVTITVTPTKPGTLTGTATVTASNVTSDGDDSAPATVTVNGT